MDVFLIILALILGIVGLIGCVVPVIPGPPISLIALLVMDYSSDNEYYSTEFLILWAFVAAVVTVIDYFFPAWFAKRFGGSKYAIRGSIFGLILGIFVLPPFGIIVGPFLGALLGQMMHENDFKKAFKVALSSFVAFILGTGLKLSVCMFMFYYLIKPIL